MNKNKTNRRFAISLILILVSFFMLLVIAYKSMVFQNEVLSSRQLTEKHAQIDRVSRDYFAALKSALPPADSVALPLQKPAFPNLQSPKGNQARQTFLRLALEPEQKLPLLIEAELNASPNDQNFWRYLLLKEHFKQKNYFALRQLSVQIRDSKFDFLLENGRTLKTEAILKIAASFCQENNPEAARQWLLRLRDLPAPSVIPTQPEEWLDLPPELAEWLKFLFSCYKISYADEIRTGWQENALVLQHEQGFVGFPAVKIIRDLGKRFLAAGFNDIAEISLNSHDENAHQLAQGQGLKVMLKTRTNASPIPGGFLLLLGLTSTAIIGLFGFALHQWQLLQKARMLDAEEQFFRQTAHDLKTPIATVSFLAETLALKRYKNEDQYNRYLNQLQTETGKASELFDRLLLSVRLRRNAVAPELRAFSPETVLAGIVNRFKPRLPDWKITSSFTAGFDIQADYEMFERVMINLIENVIRHADEGKELTIVGSDCLVNGQNLLEIKIGDRGQNFPIELKEPVDLLTDTLPYRSERGGSGTGLFLAKQIMQTHGGQFYVKNREESGIWMITTWRIA